MQKDTGDLWDVAASLDNVAVAYGGDRKLAALERSTMLRSQQMPVSEEQAGQEAKPNEEQGAASGASSYNARSGAIFGILRQMKEEFEKDLSTAQKEELQSLISFQRLRGTKTGEIHAAGELQDLSAKRTSWRSCRRRTSHGGGGCDEGRAERRPAVPARAGGEVQKRRR
ncbi:unnamed protein product [Prorocentrum cordatum]|uniref:Uncharacterized protein n=1 Tax=Prorocentrum cordatum TaxID=2364126 RepID=A0ABN9WLE7_9DINO|nr:unnamed protein product [Polarella glacialis]